MTSAMMKSDLKNNIVRLYTHWTSTVLLRIVFTIASTANSGVGLRRTKLIDTYYKLA